MIRLSHQFKFCLSVEIQKLNLGTTQVIPKLMRLSWNQLIHRFLIPMILILVFMSYKLGHMRKCLIINYIKYKTSFYDFNFIQKLPDALDREYIQSARQRVLKELTVVSKKVFQLILEKQSSYTGEIQRYPVFSNFLWPKICIKISSF